MIRVLHADDYAIIRDGLRWLISQCSDIELIGEARNGLEAVEKSKLLEPDVVVLDLQMPKLTGIDAIPQIQTVSPQSKILVLSRFGNDERVFPALEAGIAGYMLKDTSSESIIDAIESVANGESVLHASIAWRIAQEMNKRKGDVRSYVEEALTARELTILRQVAQGRGNQAIADQLMVSERTVRTHVSHILSKLHLENRTQAALYALREGLATLDDS